MKDFGLETTIPIYTGATITTAHRLRLFQHLGPYAQAPKGSGPELHHHRRRHRRSPAKLCLRLRKMCVSNPQRCPYLLTPIYSQGLQSFKSCHRQGVLAVQEIKPVLMTLPKREPQHCRYGTHEPIVLTGEHLNTAPPESQ